MLRIISGTPEEYRLQLRCWCLKLIDLIGPQHYARRNINQWEPKSPKPHSLTLQLSVNSRPANNREAMKVLCLLAILFTITVTGNAIEVVDFVSDVVDDLQHLCLTDQDCLQPLQRCDHNKVGGGFDCNLFNFRAGISVDLQLCVLLVGLCGYWRLHLPCHWISRVLLLLLSIVRILTLRAAISIKNILFWPRRLWFWRN